ncbi:methyltransferase domain-containing protein [Falsiroseomonas sp. HW251]|uniref:class I SAM-dependent DNA methyltransferase n=1 Tax=Falsiroseomonas sp. HW251 TaxID=3390998 RepID=UPI003D31A74A
MAEDADQLLSEGAARHARGDLDGAARLYRKVLARQKDDPNALNLLGVIARQRGELVRALDLSARAVALRPDSFVFLANHGAALAEAGHLPQAIRALRAALARRPDEVQTLRNLGQALTAAGEAGAALAPLARATELAPAMAEAWLALAHARREAGAEGAAEAARHAIDQAGRDGAIAEQARFLLAALGEEAAPDRAPATYVRELFDRYAPRFDQDLEGRLAYRTPALLAALLEGAGVLPDGARRVLDLGCGTGLSGVALKPFAKRMTGLDLSPRMLEVARGRGLYDRLEEADLLAWLPRQRAGFELVVAADVLNYLGDLAPALAGIRGVLVPGGIAAFSVETGEAPVALGSGLRYRHDPAHVAALAAAAGFEALARRDATLREEKGAPVAGTLFVLRRR